MHRILVIHFLSINAAGNGLLRFLTILLAFFVTPLHAVSGYEDEVLTSLVDIQGADIDSSLESINRIIDQYPNSKISHLLLADILSTRAGSKNLINNYSEDSRQLNGLRDELRYRWQNKMLYSPAHSGQLPTSLLMAAPHQEYILVVDASTARLYVYRNDSTSMTLVDDFYMTVGKSGMGKNLEGDLRTPIGVYHVTSYLPGEELPDRYGPGAFPINYPNEFDNRFNRTGYGIWIHGTESDNYNRVPLASDGCVSLSNDEFNQISRYIKTDGSTPVVIAEEFEWADPEIIEQNRNRFDELLQQWKADWENRDHDKYMRHYSEAEFRSGNFDYNRWSTHKKSVNELKSFIEVEIRNLSMFSYPGEENMIMMTFDQNYRSSNYNSSSRKSLFWKQTASGDWKIIFEG